ncbi:hypothetical protein Sbal195_4712 (plasmid) [Shewanella baltica OS195]|uniref:Uncharacterized protein n=2 Tax=Shewanella TaxID=22 RepID=A9L6T4_SHEB9|nr:hypothetical protein [Shewanella baltica]ABX51866.1 hypothetical protein Sbal195_4712 [Shewanella baltica OS195]
MIFECATRDMCFSLHLTVVLQCLAICEHQNHVPQISALWWQDTQLRYPDVTLSFSNMEHVTQEPSIDCEQCDDPIMFKVIAENETEFVLDFESMLAILSVAYEQGAISALTDEWWLTLEHIYGQPRIRT